MCGLAFDAEGRLFACGRDDGKVYVVGEGGSSALVEHINTGGSPCSLAFDHTGRLHVCDAAHRAVLVAEADGSHTPLIATHNDIALRGPHSCVFTADGDIVFSDPGPAGETSIASSRGSVYFAKAGDLAEAAAGAAAGGGALSSSGKTLPVAGSCLAYPSGVALHPGESAMYVCEQSANRLLRFTQRPAGVYHGTVFHQFAGRLGPAAVVCDHTRGGLLYVARPEAPEFAEKGIISVLSAEGALLRDLEVEGPEVTSLALSLDARYLYFAECTNNRVYRMLL